MRTLLFSFLASSLVFSTAHAAKLELDPAHTHVSFTAPHLMISKVHGRFNKFSGTFDFDEKTQKLDNVMVTIKTDSIDTGIADRDKHLRSKDFFEVTKFPEMKFKSTKVEYDKDKPDKVHGDLTIRGITKAVVLDVDYEGAITDGWKNRVVAFTAETKINRKDFGMIWNQALDEGGVGVGDEIKIKITGEAKAAAPAAPAKKK